MFVGLEGTELCDWLTGRGTTCIVSRYRVPGDDDFWDAALELHLFAAGGHAFGLRKMEQPVGVWPRLVEAWLKQIGMV